MMTHLHVIMLDYCHITLIAFDCQPPRYHILSVPNPHNCLFRRFEPKLNRNWMRFVRGGPVDVSLFCFPFFIAVLSGFWQPCVGRAGVRGVVLLVAVGRVGGQINDIHGIWDGLQDGACVTVGMETTQWWSACCHFFLLTEMKTHCK